MALLGQAKHFGVNLDLPCLLSFTLHLVYQPILLAVNLNLLRNDLFLTIFTATTLIHYDLYDLLTSSHLDCFNHFLVGLPVSDTCSPKMSCYTSFLTEQPECSSIIISQVISLPCSESSKGCPSHLVRVRSEVLSHGLRWAFQNHMLVLFLPLSPPGLLGLFPVLWTLSSASDLYIGWSFSEEDSSSRQSCALPPPVMLIHHQMPPCRISLITQ